MLYVESQLVPTVHLLLLYAKSDRDDVTMRELKRLLRGLAERTVE